MKVLTLIQKLAYIVLTILAITYSTEVHAQNCTVNAGVDISLCPGDLMTLNGYVAGLYNPSSLVWTQISGPATIIANPNSTTTTCGYAVAGSTYKFRISAICQDASTPFDEVNITIAGATPTPPATSAGATINAGCVQYGNSINLNASPAPSGFIGTWTIISGRGNFSDLNSPTSTFTPIQDRIANPDWSCRSSSNTYTLKWTLTSTDPPPSPCPTSIPTSSSIVIINTSLWNPVDAYAVIPGCSTPNNIVSLYGTCPGSGSSSWSLISGPAGFTFSTVNSQNATVNFPPVGQYTFRYTVTGSCVNGTKDVTFYITGNTYAVTGSSANAGGIQTGFCNNDIPSTMQLSANLPNGGETGTWSQSGGGTTVSFSDIHDPNAIVSGMTIGGAPYSFTWSIQNGSGCGSISSVNIFNTSSSFPSFTFNYTIGCNVSSGLGGTSYGTYQNVNLNTNDMILTPFLNDLWTFTGFNLQSKPNGSSVPLGESSYSINNSSWSTILCSSNSYVGGLGFWLVNGGPNTYWSIYTSFWGPPNMTPGIYSGIIHVTNLCGQVVEMPFSINLQHGPSASNAGTDQNLNCGVTQTFLAGNNPILTPPHFGFGTWEQISGPNTAVIANKNDRGSLVSSLIPGTYKFIWRIVAGDVCASRQDTVIIRASNIAPPDVTAGVDLTTCYGTPVTLTADLVPSGNLRNSLLSTGSYGLWTLTSGPAGSVIARPDSVTTIVTGLLANSVYVFRYSATNSCGSKFAEITITTTNTLGAPKAYAGSDQCLSAGTVTFNLNATAPSFGTGLWTKLNPADPGTITSPSSNTTTVTGATTNKLYGFVYTISAVSCTSNSDTVFISNTGPLSNANAGTDINICSPTYSSFTLSGNTPSSGTGKWSQTLGPQGALFDPNMPVTTVSVSQEGQYFFRWTISNGGTCLSTEDDVMVNYYLQPDPAVITTPNTHLCPSTNGQITLTANAPVNGFGFWSFFSGSGSISSPNNPTTLVTLRPGINKLRWTIPSLNGICLGTYDEVTLTYTPSANAYSDKSACEATSYVLKGSNPGAGAGSWSAIAQPASSPLVIFTQQGDTNYSVSPLVEGVYTFRWTVSDPNCTDSYDDMNLTINYLEAPNAGSDRCVGVNTSINLTGSAIPSGASAVWTNVNGSDYYNWFNPDPPTNANVNWYTSYLPGNYILKYTVTKQTCIRSDLVSINVVSASTAGPDQKICNYAGQFTLSGNNPPFNNVGELGIWTVKYGNPVITNPANGNSTVTIPLGDSVVLNWKLYRIEGCYFNSDDVILVNYEPPSLSDAGPAQNLCLGNTTNLSGNDPAIGNGVWSLVSGPNTPTITDPTLYNTSVTNLITGTYIFKWTIYSFDCPSSESTVTVTIGYTPPSVTCPPDLTGGSNLTGCNTDVIAVAGMPEYSETEINVLSSVFTTAGGTANSACSVITNYSYQDSKSTDCPILVTRHWKVVDAMGVISTCDQIIEIADKTPPVVTCPPAITGIECTTSIPAPYTNALEFTLAGGTISDNCLATISVSMTNEQIIPGTCSNNYTLLRTYTVSDPCGNIATCNQSITIQDLTDPSVNCPSDLTINCEDSKDPSFTGNATATDNCGYTNITYSDVSSQTNDGSCSDQNYTIIRTWTANDDCGHVNTCNQTITVHDITSPVISCISNIEVQYPAPTDVASLGSASATDNCDASPTISYSDISTQTNNGTCTDHNYTITRTWTASDNCGNLSNCVQIITVHDVPPVITCPADITINCQDPTDVASLGTATAIDNNNNSLATTYTDVTSKTSNGTCSDQNYTILRTWTAIDLCGNINTCVQTITVQDISEPIISGPATVTVNCQDPIDPASIGFVTATDNCDADLTVSFSDVSTKTNNGTCSDQNYTLTRTWTATDNCGNFSTFIQTITVQDITPPTFDTPPDMILNKNIYYTPGTYTIVNYNFNTGASYAALTPLVFNNISASATNSAVPFNTGAGTATSISAFTQNATAGNALQVTNSANPSTNYWQFNFSGSNLPNATNFAVFCQAYRATNNSASTLTLTYNANNGGWNPLSSFSLNSGSWTPCTAALPALNNLTSLSIRATYSGGSGGGNRQLRLDNFQLRANMELNSGNATNIADNCDLTPTVSYTDVTTAGSCPGNLIVNRTWRVEDNCGNFSNSIQTISIEDLTQPIISCPPDITVNCQDSKLPAATGTATATDDSGTPPSITYSDAIANGSCAGNYVITRTWTATDNCGNASSCNQLITVHDITVPVITNCGPAQTATANALCQAAVPTFIASVVASDNCTSSGALLISQNPAIGTLVGLGNTIVTITVTDACGNTATCTNTFTVSNLNISGTVYNDVNGKNNNLIDGTGIGTVGASQLYANLSVSGNVVGVTPVNSNGTYTFDCSKGSMANTTFNITISTVQGTLGNPVAAALPSGWVNTADRLGSGDGTDNGITTISIVNTNISTINFGIEQIPLANNNTLPDQVNPGGTNNFTVPSTLFTGSDFSSGIITSIRITGFPGNTNSITINGINYTSGTFPVGGITIPSNTSGNPTQPILIDPIDGLVLVNIPYVTIDNATFESIPANAGIPFYNLTLSGNVYNDRFGMNSGDKVDGFGIGSAGATHLYVSLVSSGIVHQTVSVNNDGTYLFQNLNNSLNYTIILTISNTTAGNPEPLPLLPTDWLNTGEINNDAGNTLTGTDGTTNGIIVVGILSNNETNLNFGIEQRPESYPVSQLYFNPGGINQVLVPSLNGSDPEDCPVVGSCSTNNDFIILTLPSNGTLFYSGTAVMSSNFIINNYNPALLTFDPDDGNIVATFTYSLIDDAGMEDLSPATAILNFNDITIIGNVFDDNDALLDNQVDGVGTNASESIYANLVNPLNNIILASIPVSSGGSFIFTSANGVQVNTIYNIILTNGPKAVGSNLTLATILSPWITTGEHLGAGTGDDGLANSILPVSVNLTPVNNANFGIELPPHANNSSSPIQENLGGTNSITVPETLFSGSDPDGNITSIYIPSFPSHITSLIINGNTYNIGNFPLGGVIIPANFSGNPTQSIAIDPVEGYIVVTIPFVTIDNADYASSSAAITLPFFTLPTVSCPAAIVIPNTNTSCSGNASGLASMYFDYDGIQNLTWTITGTTDDSSPLTGINNINAHSFNVGTSTVTFIVTNIHGYTASCSYTVIVNDAEQPIINCPAPFNLNTSPGNCSVVVNYDVNATDNCSLTSLLRTQGPASGSAIPTGTTTIEFQATDATGNTSTCSFTINVTDNQDPIITCPTNINTLADPGACNSTVFVPVPVTSDNCGVSSLLNNFNGTANASGTYPVGTTTVIWTVTDVHGRSATCSMSVTVVDNQNPGIVCPANIFLNADPGACSALVTVPSPVTSDNCGVASVINSFTGTSNASATYPVGITTVIWTVTDVNGDTATCTMSVSVVDNQNPTIGCPLDISLNTGLGGCATLVSVPAPVVDDNCAVLSVANSFTGTSNATGVYPVGTTVVVWTVTDIHGLSATCSMSVSLIDNQAPSIICPSDITVNADPAACNAVVSVPAPLTSDFCGVSTLVNSFNGTSNASGTYPVGTTPVTWTVTDIHGLSATCSMNITVLDNQNPTISCPANISLNAALGTCSASVTVPVPSSGDNCGVTSVVNNYNGTSNASGTYPVGITTVIWTVTDIHGRTATCAMSVSVVDNQNPSIVCPANILVNAVPGLCNAVVSVPDPEVTDNCSVLSVVNNFTGTANASATYPVGTTTVVWTVNDVNGRTASCSMSVTVVDNQNPTILCPANISVNTDPGLCNAAVTVPAPVVGDNCYVLSVQNNYTGTANASATYPVGTTNVVWTVTDVHGRTASCSMSVTVVDNQNPNISCPVNISVNAAPGSCSMDVVVPAPVIWDNCATYSLTNTFNNGTNASGTYPVGTTTIIWTLTDIHGLSSTCSMNVTVVDNQNPTIACPANISVNATSGVCNALVTVPSPLTSDNCGVLSVVNSFTGTSNASGTYPVGTTSVVWTVTDVHGRTASCAQTVTVSDNQNPTIVCPANISVNATNGACNASITVPAPATGDNCGVLSVTNSFTGTSNASGTYPVGTTTVVWTVSDTHGLTASCSMSVTVTDNQNPTITCPSNITVNAAPGLCNALVSVPAPVTGDNCGVLSVTNSFTGTSIASGTYPVGTTTVVWTVTDVHGRTASCSMSIAVTDNQNPTIVCPANISVNASNGLCNALVTVPAPTTADNCGVASVTNNFTGTSNASGTYPVGTTTVVWTVTDVNGRSATCSMSVSVVDNQNPVIVCPSSVNTVTNPGSCVATVSMPTPFTSDNCGVASIVNSFNGTSNASGNYPFGTTTVVWTVTDLSGRTATCSLIVTVTDNQNPLITCPANINVNTAPGVCNALVTVPAPIAGDNCGVLSVVNSFTGTSNASGTYPVGTTVVVWTVSDVHGHSASCQMSVTVTDNQNPTIVCPANISVNAAQGLCNAIVNVPAPVVGDNCGVDHYFNSFTGTSNASGTYPVGTTTVIWTVTDVHGKTATCAMSVTVTDNQHPAISCAPAMSVFADQGQCSRVLSVPVPIVSDNCGILSLINSFNSTANASGTYPVGTTTIVWTVTDIHGNTATCSSLVSVVDNQDPVINCPGIISASSNPGACSASVTVPAPIASDNCGILSVLNSFNLTNNASGTYPVGNTTVIWTATDINGNSATCATTVSVVDIQPPSISCPSNININASQGGCNTSVTIPVPVASDNCGVLSLVNSFTQGANASGNYPVGTTTVIWTATDIHGNSASCSSSVIVVDDQSPSISCPQNISVDANAGACNALVSVPAPVVNDNCGSVTVINSFTATANATATYPVGTTIVTWTATDAHGYSATCSMSVTVTDNQNPTISCPANVSVNAAPGLCNAAVTVPSPVASDNCGVASVINSFNATSNASGTYPVGTTTVIWTVTDFHGRTATCAQTVTVTDNQNPGISCPSNINVNAAAGICGAVVNVPTPITSDNCGVLSVVSSHSSSSYPVGTTTVIWTVTDTHSNSATCSMSVTVTDTQSPLLSCPANITIPVNPGTCSASNVNLGNPITSDNCGTVTLSNNAPSVYTLGNNTVIWTATDAYGHSVTCAQTVTVVDNQPPAITCPSDISVTADQGMCSAYNVNLGSPVASDNCAVASVSNNAPSVYPIGTTTVIWVVTDASGNTASCAQTVSVTENSLPSIECPAPVSVFADQGICGAANVDLGTPLASDPCSAVTLSNDAPSIFPVGTTTVIWIVTDASGNTASCAQLISVIDAQPPVISCNDDIVVDATNDCSSDVALVPPVVTDNCSEYTISSDAPALFPFGTTIVTWTAMDMAGNSTFCTQIITIVDNTPPVIECPQHINVTCNTAVTVPLPIYSDNCGVASVTNSFTGGIDASATYPLGTTEVCYTITDIHGNSSICCFNVIVTCPIQAVVDSSYTPIGTPVLIDIVDNDTVMEEPVVCDDITIINDPLNGSVVVNTLTGEIIYTPDFGFIGMDSLQYMICCYASGISVCDSTWVYITIDNPPVASIIGGGVICEGGTAYLMVQLSGTAPFTLQLSDGVNITTYTGITASLYTIAVSPSLTTTYTIYSITDATGISVPGTGSAVVTVNTITPYLVTGGGSLCPGEPGVVIGLTGSDIGTSYQLLFNGNPISNLIPGTGSALSLGQFTQAGYYTVMAYSAQCSAQLPGTAVVIVNPGVQLWEVTGGGACCLGCTDIHVGLNGSEQGVYYTLWLDGSIEVAHLWGSGSYLDFGYVTTGGYYTITGINQYGCTGQMTGGVTAILYPRATAVLTTGPTTICSGGTATLAVSLPSGTPPWTITLFDGMNSSVYPNIMNSPVLINVSPAATTTYSVPFVTDIHNCGSFGSGSTTVTVVNCPSGLSVAGKLLYNNNAQTPMNNTAVLLKQNGSIISSYLTDAQGNYNFNNLSAGTYSLDADITKPWGGANATDALLIMQHFTQIINLTGMNLQTADVVSLGAVNAVDALAVAKRFVGQLPAFTAGNWYNEKPQITLGVNNTSLDFRAQCFGDVNATYNPPYVKLPSYVEILPAGVQYYNKGQTIELPLRLTEPMNVGAISLVLSYPSQLLTITDVKVKGEGVKGEGVKGEGVLFSANDGELRIAWYDQGGRSFSTLDEMITLEIVVGNASDKALSFEALSGSEIADQMAVVHPVSLTMPKLVLEQLMPQVNVYPNPFSEFTEFNYILPQDAVVTLRILDALGRQISVPLKGELQNSGSHSFRLEASSLSQGMYQYILEVKSDGQVWKQNGKLILSR